MQHITLNTGHISTIRDGDISRETVQRLKPLCKQGGPLKDFPGHRVEILHAPGGAIVTMYVRARGVDAPCVCFVVCWEPDSAEMAWNQVEKLYLDTFRLGAASQNALVERPAEIPWVASCLLPGLQASRETASWVGDFERSLAWTLWRMALRSARG